MILSPGSSGICFMSMQVAEAPNIIVTTREIETFINNVWIIVLAFHAAINIIDLILPSKCLDTGDGHKSKKMS